MQLPRSWPRILVLLAIGGAFASVMLLAASYLYLAPKLPPAAKIKKVDYQIPMRIYSRDGALLGEFGEKRRTPLQYNQFPKPFIQAVLSAEDEHFFQHGGVDLKGLLRAAVELVRYREIRSGGSTITMQVARNFFLSRDQRFLRKFNEIVLAMQIENILTKDEILTLYLNKIYLGHRAYGAEAAAHVYYGKPLKELTLAQWAMIAGLPKAPSAYNPITNPKRAQERRNWILGRMHKDGFITVAQRDDARAQPVTASYHGTSPGVQAGYLAEMVRRKVVQRMGEDVYTSGLKVYTTIDSQKQKDAVQAVRRGLHEYDERHGWRGPIAHISTDDLPSLPPATTTDQKDDGSNPVAVAKPVKELENAMSRAGDETAAQQWADTIKSRDPVADMVPAVVAQVKDKSARVVRKDASVITLPWDALSWASPYRNTNVVGAAPKTAGDVLKVGDIIWIRRDGKDNQGNPQWRLAQIPQAQSALVSMDPQTGAILALQGGFSFDLSKYNRAIQGERQAGSSFKPYIYSAALLSGMTPATVINDAPIVFKDKKLETSWRPTGAESHFFGPTRLRAGLYHSLNLVSIRVLQRVGIDKTLKVTKRFGLPVDRFPHDLSLALGSATVTPLEQASGYCVFANGGFRMKPWYIDHIVNNNGTTIWQAPTVKICDKDCQAAQQQQAGNAPSADETDQTGNSVAAVNKDDKTGGAAASDADNTDDTPPPEQANDASDFDGYPLKDEPPVVYRYRVLNAQVAWLMDSMLKDVIRKGTGRRARALGRSDLAGKTGTTNQQVDAWFTGYSPALVASTWVGFDTPATLGRGEYGAVAALPIWMKYMGAALKGTPEQHRPQPPGIVSVRIDPKTGKRALPGDKNAMFEYFRRGNVPPPSQGGQSGKSDSGSGSPDHLF